MDCFWKRGILAENAPKRQISEKPPFRRSKAAENLRRLLSKAESLPHCSSGLTVTPMPSSPSCSSSTGEGAFVISSLAF